MINAMKNKLFKLVTCLILAVGLLASNVAKSQTAGTMSFTVNPVSHSGNYGIFHYTVIWVQGPTGSFVKTLYRSQLTPGKDVWEHCKVWVATNNTYTYGNVIDATTSATLLNYTSPLTNTWNGTDTTLAAFKLLPDGIYRVFIENAWDASMVYGVGKDTASFTFTKGPSPVTLTPASVTNFNGISLSWTPAANTNTIATSAVGPTYAAGAAVSVPFTIGGTSTIYANNVWTAQLSNAAGLFTSPVTIGTLSGITAGTISATIPAGTLAGTGYKIRVIGTAPGTIGTDNGASITITNGTAPVLAPAALATVDNAFDVTFPEDATWRGAITAIKIGGTTLTAGSTTTTAGKITFTPSVSAPANLLQIPGNLNITVIATGYADVNLIQALGVGIPAKLAVKTQPTAPGTSGGMLATQPAIYIQDQYGNLTASTASITAAVGTGTWTIGGTTAIAATAGTATFTNLTATSLPYVTATIAFTSGTLTTVSSNAFSFSGIVAGGTVTVGTGGTETYTSFTRADGLFNAINTGGISGNIIANVTTDISNEDGAVALNQWFESGGSGYTLKIQPIGAARTISGTVAAPLFNFNGADRVTIDGSTIGLTISNLSVAATAGTSTIKFSGDATNNTITNCSVLGSGLAPLATDGGTIWLGLGVTTGNDNITISNCKIGPAGTNLPSKGIYSNGNTGSAAKANSTIAVTGCEIYDFSLAAGSAGIYALLGNTDWTISNNKLYQTAARSYATAGTMYAIYIVSPVVGDNIQITGNTIGFSSNTGTGTLTVGGTITGAGAFQAINFASLSSAATTCNINNNIISDISITATGTSSSAFTGINGATTPGSCIVNVNNNQVRNIATVTTGAVQAIIAGGAGTLNCNSNIVENITRTAAGNIYGIRYNAPVTFNCNTNIVRNLAFNVATGTSAIYGYSNNAPVTTENIIGNSFYNVTSNSTAAQPIIGYYSQYATSAGTKTIQNNTFHDITAAAGAATIYGIRNVAGTVADISGNTINTLSGGITIYGITVGAGNNNVYKNKVYGFSTAHAGPTVYGLNVAGGTTNNLYNNYIGDLTTTAAATATPLAGINVGGTAATTTNLYYNTVYLNATSTGALFGSAAVYALTTSNLNLRNNIFVNTSTPAGALGFTSAYRRSDATLATYSATSNNNLFYAGTAGTNNLLMYDGTNSYQALSAYQTAMATRDAASITENPNWVSTTGANATYLHINTTVATGIESGAAPIATFADDFEGDTRNSSTPDIGADEFAGISLTVSVESNSLNGNVNIYPNPTSDMINIAFNQLSGNCKINIANALGATVYEENVDQITNSVKSIDLSKYSNGIYFVNIKVQNNELRYKVVLNR